VTKPTRSGTASSGERTTERRIVANPAAANRNSRSSCPVAPDPADHPEGPDELPDGDLEQDEFAFGPVLQLGVAGGDGVNDVDRGTTPTSGAGEGTHNCGHTCSVTLDAARSDWGMAEVVYSLIVNVNHWSDCGKGTSFRRYREGTPNDPHRNKTDTLRPRAAQ
jgi:hypothetical protein